MSGAQVLLEALEDLENNDFQTLKWYLSQRLVEGCRPIACCHLENATRTKTTGLLLSSYGPDIAVKVCVDVLTRMNRNNSAQELQQAYAVERASRPDLVGPAPAGPGPGPGPGTLVGPGTPAGPGVPASLMAQGGSVIVAPTMTGGSAGTWNFNIYK